MSESSLLFLNSSLGFAGGKHYQKITNLIFGLFLQNFAFSRLISLLFLLFLVTFFWLCCYCSKWFYVSPGNWVPSLFYPSALRAGGVLSSRSGRAGGWAGGCQTCGTHISLAHGPKTCQICHKLGPDFAERISLKLLNGFTPFKVSWTCLDL